MNTWIKELKSALTSDLDTLGKELFAESKVHALEIKINLAAVPRIRCTFSDEEKEEFYVNLFKKVFEAAMNSLIRRYSSRPLQMSNFFL